MQLRRDPLILQAWKWAETHPTARWCVIGGWLAAIGILTCLWQLGNIGLVDETEPLFVEAARQMTLTGDWVTPYFNEVTRFDKPPLVYWLMAIAFKVLGVNEWAARLPSALSALALMGMGFYTLQRFGWPQVNLDRASDRASDPQLAIAPVDPQASDPGDPAARQDRLGAWVAAAIGATLIVLNPETIGWARIAVSDMLLSGCIGIALFAFFLAYAQPQYPRRQAGWYLTVYISLGLGVLTKGPIGIVLPGLIIGTFLLYVGQWRAVLREMYVIPGAIIFGAIAIPWYVLVIQANGQAYIDSFFGYHNFERFTSVVNNHSAPWFFYFLVVLLGFAPWSTYLPLAIGHWRVWRWQDWRQTPRSQQLGLFALTWFLVIFGFFTVAATKLPSYVLPLMPAAAILVGLLCSDRLTHRRGSDWGLGLTVGFNIALCIALAVVAPYSPNWMDDDPAMPNLPEVVRAAGIMTTAAIVWGSAAIAGIGLLITRQARWMWAVNLVAMVLFVGTTVIPGLAIMDSQRQLHLRTLATTLRASHQPGEEIIMVGFEKPTVVFYSQLSVNFIRLTDETETYLNTTLDPVEKPSVLLIGRTTKLNEIDLNTATMVSIQAIEPYELVRVSATLGQ